MRKVCVCVVRATALLFCLKLIVQPRLVFSNREARAGEVWWPRVGYARVHVTFNILISKPKRYEISLSLPDFCVGVLSHMRIIHHQLILGFSRFVISAD